MIKETMSFSDEFKSPILSSACGFDVTLTVTGTIRVLTFPARPVGPDDLSTGNVAVVATNTSSIPIAGLAAAGSNLTVRSSP